MADRSWRLMGAKTHRSEPAGQRAAPALGPMAFALRHAAKASIAIPEEVSGVI